MPAGQPTKPLTQQQNNDLHSFEQLARRAYALADTDGHGWLPDASARRFSASMSALFTKRPMRFADIPSILEIQALCYTELVPESVDSLNAKLSASPATCHVACQHDKVIGYLISLPVLFDSPPELNAATCSIPAHPDSLYLHDLAVAPGARKSGAGTALVQQFIAQAGALNFSHASLIAVQNSRRYWQRHGFCPVPPTPAIRAKLASYGNNAVYMERHTWEIITKT